MKVYTPLIAWHNRERVSSADFQPVPYPDGQSRLATGGDDKHVVIWELVTDKDGKVEPQCLCDLSRHQNSVNIVRWSPNGRILASGDTDSGILLWQYSDKDVAPDLFGEDAEMRDPDEDLAPTKRENWIIFRTLRGHLQDVVDISWSPCSTFLVSCSTDNTAIVFDTSKDKKVKILGEHKGWVNGVAWDPSDQYIATIASDRCLRMYKTKNYKIAFKTYKANLPVPVQSKGDQDPDAESNKENEEKLVRLFHDDTFQSFYRRIGFSPDGELLGVPSGVLEIEGETTIANCTYLFSKANLAKPVLYLPSKEFSVAVRFSPIKYELRPVLREGVKADDDEAKNLAPWEKYQTLFCLPYRMVYAVATQNTVVFYDTQQAEPFAKISKIHYIGLNDLTWSADGNSVFICSTDGYCTIASFASNEFGKVFTGDCADKKTENENVEKTVDENGCADEKDVKAEVLSKDGIALDNEGVASPARIHIRSVKEGGKPNPKRLQLITLSSPKSSRKANSEETAAIGCEEKKGSSIMDVIDDGTTRDLNLVYEDDDEVKPTIVVKTNAVQSGSAEKKKKRVPLTTVSSASPGAGGSSAKSDDCQKSPNVSKVGRRVNLITLCSPADPKKNC